MRTAGAEIRDALRNIFGLSGDALKFLEPRDASGNIVIAMVFQKPVADADRDLIGIKCPFDRKQPIALLVPLADAERLVGGAVEFLAHLHFKERPLFLNDNDEIEAFRKLLQLALAERPCARDLIKSDAELVTFDLVDAEFVERLPNIEIAFAGGDDADLRVAAARSDGAVELVGAHEGKHRVALVIVQPRLLGKDRIVEADIKSAFGHRKVGRDDDVDPLQAGVNRRRRFDGLVHRLERNPGAGEARHRPTVEAVIENLLDPRGVQDRDHNVDEMIFGLVRGGRGFGGVVVAHQRQHATMFR